MKDTTLKQGIISLIILLLIIIIPKMDLTILKSLFKSLFYITFNNYSYYNPPIFLSIGEAVAAIAIVLTVYQIKKEDWAIALEVRKGIFFIVISLSVLGLIFVIISSIIPITFSQPTNILHLSLFWQLGGGILILCAPIFLFWRTRSRDLFNNRTKERFSSVLLKKVSSRSKKSMDLVTDVLMWNLNKILELVNSRVSPQKITELMKYANSILVEIVSDSFFAKHIVTSRVDFFQFFLNRIKKLRCYGERSVTLVFKSFVKASFENKSSYFYNELEYTGSGIYKPFLNDIFFDQNIFLNLEPFEEFDFLTDDKVDPVKLNLFITALKIAIKGYWNNKYPGDFEYSHFNRAFEKIKDAFSKIIYEIQSGESKDDLYVTRMIHQITFFVGHSFIYDYKKAVKKNKVSQQDLDVIVERKSYGIYPKTLTAGYARLVFNLLCLLNRYPKKELIRLNAISLTTNVLRGDEPEFFKIREVLLEYIWEKIKENVETGYYPVILSIYLSLIGMWQDGASSQKKEEYNRIVRFLYKKLKPKILKGEKMANGDLMENQLLPLEVKFNRKKKIFEWQFRNGVQEMKERK